MLQLLLSKSLRGERALQICDLIEAAQGQAEALAAPGVVDLTVDNGSSAAFAAAALRAHLARHWSATPHAEPCQALVETFEPMAGAVRRTVRRMRHVSAVSSTLELPRGRHVLRLTVDSNYLHQFSVWSHGKVTLAPAASVLANQPGLHLLEAAEALPHVAAGGWRVGARHTFRVDATCNVSISLRCAPEAVQRCARIVLVDNAARAERELILGELDNAPLRQSTAGYTVMVLLRAPDVALSEGSYRLNITSTKPLSGFAPEPCGRCDHHEGVYSPCQRAEVWRYALTAATPCVFAVRAQLSVAGAAGTLTLEAVPDAGAAAGKAGAAAKKPAPVEKAPSAAESKPAAPLLQRPVGEQAEIAMVALPAGRSVLSLTLDRARCAFDIAPDGSLILDDANRQQSQGAARLGWKLDIAPTADEKTCVIAKDAGHEVAQQAQLKQWVESGPGGAKLRPANGKAAVQKHVDAKRAAHEKGQPVTVVRICLLCLRHVLADEQQRLQRITPLVVITLPHLLWQDVDALLQE